MQINLEPAVVKTALTAWNLHWTGVHQTLYIVVMLESTKTMELSKDKYYSTTFRLGLQSLSGDVCRNNSISFYQYTFL